MPDSSSSCFHCGQPIAEGSHYQVEIDGQNRSMCCSGCEAVAQAIVENGLTDFYQFRTDRSETPTSLVPDELLKLDVYDSDALQQSFVRAEEDGVIREASLILEGIVCAACVWLNEKHVKALDGVLDFKINYSTHRATLTWNSKEIKLSDVLAAISSIGYHAHPFDPGRLEALQKREKSAALKRIAIAGVGMMQVMMLSIALYIGESGDMSQAMQQFIRWISLIITTPVLLFASRVFFTSAWRDLKKKQLGMDVPVALAMGFAFSASAWATVTQTGEVYFDSVTMFTFFLLSGRYLEMMARHKAGQVADELVRLVPATATRLEGKETNTVAVSELVRDDLVLIKPGETIVADGVVVDGVSSVNESLLTGESLPLVKKKGDSLIGGTVNVESALTMRVSALGDGTILSSIIRLLDRAQSEKPALATLADRIAAWFVSIILLIAVVVFATWSVYAPTEAFWIMLSVLVVTCPCALSLATPAALTTATGALTEKGVLVTRGHALEGLSKPDVFVFDKTGTLTYGRLKVVGFKSFGDVNECFLRRVAAGLEQHSEHPVGAAIQAYEKQPAQCLNIRIQSGKGVEGQYENSTYRIGSYDFVAEIAGDLPVSHGIEGHDGSSIVYLGCNAQWLSVIYLQDEIRKEAGDAIKTIQQQGMKVVLLSGDDCAVVETVAKQLNIEQAEGNLMPEQKLSHIHALQRNGQRVVMVGDGVNDAPVLAGADVSIAMGQGAQLAQASADMVLLSENLMHLPFAVRVAKRTRVIIKQNFLWAVFYNLLAVPVAAAGLIAPWVAAIGMSASSAIVVLNALRLK